MKDTRYTIKKGFTKTPKVRPNLSFTYVNEENFEANMRAFADSIDLENKTRQVHSFTLLEAKRELMMDVWPTSLRKEINRLDMFGSTKTTCTMFFLARPDAVMMMKPY